MVANDNWISPKVILNTIDVLYDEEEEERILTLRTIPIVRLVIY